MERNCKNCMHYNTITHKCSHANVCTSTKTTPDEIVIPSHWESKESPFSMNELPKHLSTTYRAYNSMYKPKTPKQKALERIKNVIFNDPVTVVIWNDGTKTIVRCGEGETYDPEKGLAMAISKYFFDNKGYFNEVFKKWLPDDKTEIVTGVAHKPEAITIQAEEVYMTIKQYCIDHNITKNKVYGMIKRKEIDAYKNGEGLWMVKVEED